MKAILPGITYLKMSVLVTTWPHFSWARGPGPHTIMPLGERTDRYKKVSPGTAMHTLTQHACKTKVAFFLQYTFTDKQALTHLDLTSISLYYDSGKGKLVSISKRQ